MSVDQSHQDTKTEGLSAKRRAFIKGSASTIPAILTLHSGAALATASIASCIAKNQNAATQPNPLPPTLLASADKWGRMPSQTVTLANGITLFQWPINTGNWYDAKSDTSSTPYFQQAGSLNWQYNNDGTNIAAAGSITSTFVLVEFDTNGNAIGYGAGKASFEGASSSCLTSLNITGIQ